MVSYINPPLKGYPVPSRDHPCNAGQETDIADLPPEALQSLGESLEKHLETGDIWLLPSLKLT